MTLHERHGVPLALNAGDALAMFAVERLHEAVLVGDSVLASRLRHEFGQAVRRTVEGQALELGWQRDGVVDLRPEDYLDMAVLKTCAYTTVLPLRAGALLARAASIDLDALTARHDRLRGRSPELGCEQGEMHQRCCHGWPSRGPHQGSDPWSSGRCGPPSVLSLRR